MAQAICELGQYISKEEVIQYVLPPVIAIMKDSVTEVRVSLMENMDKLAMAIGEENIKIHIIPEV